MYRYSPEFSDFALNCLKSVIDYIYLPATVLLEFCNHCGNMFLDMGRRVSQAEKETENEIEAARRKIIKSCDNMARLHYPDTYILVKELSEKIDDVRTTLDNYFDDHLSLNLIQHSWNEVDCLRAFVDEIENANHVMPSPSQEDIYRWCEDGEQRYKRKIPPGFMDARDKDVVRKYSDLILWNETVRFAKTHGKSIIFVTDDVKADWWEVDNGKRHFHTNLLKEFCRTKQNIIPMVSQTVYTEIANDFNIEKTDTVEIALRMTDEDYCFKIADAVFEEIEDTLAYDAIEFIDVESAHKEQSKEKKLDRIKKFAFFFESSIAMTAISLVIDQLMAGFVMLAVTTVVNFGTSIVNDSKHIKRLKNSTSDEIINRLYATREPFAVITDRIRNAVEQTVV